MNSIELEQALLGCLITNSDYVDSVKQYIPEDDFFFIPHAGNTKSIISGYRENVEDAQKMVLLMQSAFEKVPEKNRQRYNEGFNRVLHEAFQESFKQGQASRNCGEQSGQ